jgi:BMFP domain-containing protein YqiC
MVEPQIVEQLLESLRNAIPGGLAEDVAKNTRAALAAALTKINLVTREEFDVQSQVLARTRARLETLERQLAELEQRIARS